MLDMALWQGNMELVTGVLLEECQKIRNEWRRQNPKSSVFGWRNISER